MCVAKTRGGPAEDQVHKLRWGLEGEEPQLYSGGCRPDESATWGSRFRSDASRVELAARAVVPSLPEALLCRLCGTAPIPGER